MASPQTSTSSIETDGTSSRDSVYYIHPSDNLGTPIIPNVLKEDNYSEWATEIWNSLQAKQKIVFLDGSIIKPSENPLLAKWTAVNSMIVGWIRTSIEPQLRSTISYMSDASQLWESIKTRFSVKNGVRKHLLLDEITNCKQNGQSVLEFFGRLTKLWDDYNHVATPISCTCAASQRLDKEREDARVHRFLFGLDESRFRSLRSQFIDEEPLPPLNSVYARVVREEQHLHTMRSKEIKHEAIGFSVNTESLAL